MDQDRPLQPHELVAEGLGGVFPNVAAPLPTPPLSATEELEDMALSSNDFSLTKMRAADDPNPATYTTDVDITRTLGDGRTVQLAVANVPQLYTDARAKGIIPDAPTGLWDNNRTVDSFEALWDAVSNADNYLFDVSDGPGFASFLPDGENFETGSPVTTVHSLQAGTTYYWRVRARAFGNLSPYSETATTTTSA